MRLPTSNRRSLPTPARGRLHLFQESPVFLFRSLPGGAIGVFPEVRVTNEMFDHRRGRSPAGLAGVPLVIEGDGPPLAGDIQNILVGELVAVAVQQVERRAVERKGADQAEIHQQDSGVQVSGNPAVT